MADKHITQVERVYDYLVRFGSITSFEAFRDLGVTRLSAVIYTLKRRSDLLGDYVIIAYPESGRNRFGDITNFVRYKLEDIECL